MWIISTAPKTKQKVRLQWTRRASEWEARGRESLSSLQSGYWLCRGFMAAAHLLCTSYMPTHSHPSIQHKIHCYVRSFSRRWRSSQVRPLTLDHIPPAARVLLSGELRWTVFPQVAKWHDFLLRRRAHTVRRVPQIDVADAVVSCGARELFATGWV